MRKDNIIKLNLKKKKVLLLFSGGLDSILAAKILKRQGFVVRALYFKSFFFDADQAQESARANDVELKVIDISRQHLKVVRLPRFGCGRAMNPCVDCHLLMLKLAKKIARKEKFDIIATGEVLGQRPMSQNKDALELIEKNSSLVGKILRPLSAKVLPETVYEKKGIVRREKLLGISGKGRKEQQKLAKEFGIKEFPSPAGGCRLTQIEYSQKLKNLLTKKRLTERDFKLLSVGRHFWQDSSLIIIGRNHKENLMLEKLYKKGDCLISLVNVPGPLALVRWPTKKSVKKARELILQYTKKLPEGEKPVFKINKKARTV